MTGSAGESRASYDGRPFTAIGDQPGVCRRTVEEVCSTLRGSVVAAAARGSSQIRVVLECYPGVILDEFLPGLGKALGGEATFHDAAACFKSPASLREQFQPALTSDPVFALMQDWDIDVYLDQDALRALHEQIESNPGLAVVFGTGAIRLVQAPDLLVHIGSTRWVLQGRQRAHQIGNLGFDNRESSPAELYKNAFFLEWRVGDKIRHELYPRVDWFIDLDDPAVPNMLPGDELREAVRKLARQPFRVVPFFDPGPWGGQWMKRRFGLPPEAPNYAWCFDCVPEENSVLLGFGDRLFSLPAQVLVQEEPEALLGRDVYLRFGAEFPIRFDLLDTVEGGNLSLQVHPLQSYIREHFGMKYTQDESYYILDCEPGSELYLGLREGVQPAAFAEALREANDGAGQLDARLWVNVFPTHRHDHFSIPAGTVHCSGKDNVVLEISATPYIFTFKLWDWGRLGLDGKPRPVHLEHGLANIQWNRDTEWVREELLQPTVRIREGEGWYEERTGLHPLQFIETRRHWFTQPVTHCTNGTVHVLNLVEGEQAWVESPEARFPPFLVHYGETFIVPAAVGAYVVRPADGAAKPLATIQASVRPDSEQGR